SKHNVSTHCVVRVIVTDVDVTTGCAQKCVCSGWLVDADAVSIIVRVAPEHLRSWAERVDLLVSVLVRSNRQDIHAVRKNGLENLHHIKDVADELILCTGRSDVEFSK